MGVNAGRSGTGSHFSMIPRAEIPRSTFDRSHGYKTTFDEGYLIPIYVDEVLPGDTHQVHLTAFARLNTVFKPVMDNAYMDFFFFFVPNRLLWTNWQKFMGEQTNPGDSISYVIPYITQPMTTAVKTLADYFGIPINYAAQSNTKVNALPFRAYNLIYNQWFRDQNLINSVTQITGDGPDALSNYTLLKRGKRHDYFTGCLPQPQRGAVPVSIPLGTSAVVKGIGVAGGIASASSTWWDATGTQQTRFAFSTANTSVVLDDKTQSAAVPSATHYPNIYADLSTATAATINSLRQAFQIQRLLERDARGGTRYTEILQAHFGVVSPDARLQRPEYLGGGTVPIQVNPVTQTSPLPSTGTLTPQGNLAGYGTAAGGGIGFSKSFVEHGYILGLVCVRADMTYQYGLDKMWQRSTRYDFYWPAFANLGEQAVLDSEIYSDGSANDATVFGYQERWAEYRYKPSKITGLFRSNAASTLDVWHLAQKFAAAPSLNQAFIEEPVDAASGSGLTRAVAVPAEPHFLFDSHFNVKSTRPMPVYSVPGMIDHF